MWVQWCLECCAHGDLINNITSVASMGEISVGTLCSGLGVAEMALDAIQEMWAQKYKEPLRFRHEFACEIEPVKQDHLRRNFKLNALFTDMRHVAKGRALDVRGPDLRFLCVRV